MSSCSSTATTLAEALQGRPLAYLLTDSAGGPPHVVAASVQWQAPRLQLAQAGTRSRSQAERNPAVALLWPPADAGGYSLIVDGQAEVDGEGLRIRPTRAVLHRSGAVAAAAGAAAEGCVSDCVELKLA